MDTHTQQQCYVLLLLGLPEGMFASGRSICTSAEGAAYKLFYYIVVPAWMQRAEELAVLDCQWHNAVVLMELCNLQRA